MGVRLWQSEEGFGRGYFEQQKWQEGQEQTR